MKSSPLLARRTGRRHKETWYGSTGLIWSLDMNDRRHIWQEVSPGTGLTLRQAMLYYGPEAVAECFYDLDAQGYGGDPPMLYGTDGWPTSPEILSDFRIKSGQLRDARLRLEFCLVRKLVTGELVATGYAASGPLDEPARPIAADRWRTLTPDYETSQATGPGILVSGILVFKKQPKGKVTAPPRSAAPARVRTWYRQWVDTNVASGTQPSRERDMEAARGELGISVSRELLRDLRRELAPPAWRQFGRRRNSD